MKRKLVLFTSCWLLISHFCFGMVITFNIIHDNCNESHGKIHCNVSGGTPPYTYLWSTSATADSIVNLPGGIYTVTVTDFVGSSATGSAAIINSPTLVTDYGSVPYLSSPSAFGVFTCGNSCTGIIGLPLNMINGTPPYNFTSNVGIVHPGFPYPLVTTVSDICAGASVYIIITDSLGCSVQSTTENMYSPPNANLSFNISPSCDSMANGVVTVSNIPSWVSPWSSQTCIVTDTNLWLFCTPGNCTNGSSTVTVGNLLPGNYYFGIRYADTDTACSFGAYHWGCPQYAPFTIPDLGTNCGAVEGDVFLDLNADCVRDTGENGIPNTVVEFTPGPIYAYTDMWGHYSANLDWGNYNMTHYPASSLTQICPANPYPISLSFSNQTDTVNFADTSNIPSAPILPLDAAAYLSHGAAHPGFNFNYGVNVRNLGNTPSGILTVTLDYDTVLSFVSANPLPFSTSLGQVVWQLNSIANFQSTGAIVTLSVPPNPLLIGDTLHASGNVQAANPETNLANNTATTVHIITGSFDPNVKTVETPAPTFIPAIDGLFNYTIQFQNTGNDTAFNIEVRDTLDSDLDVTTFVPWASSHPYTTELTGHGVIHFHFYNINLPDSTTDEPHSHGFVSFQIRCKANLPHGTAINNTSNIIFDFNPPVNTNTTANTVDLTLGISATTTTICAGQSVTLNMIPELQTTTWKWRAGNCSSSIIGSGNSITVSPAVTTTYFVRDSAGTIQVGACYRKTIVVNPLPSSNITAGGPTTFCAGNSVILTTATTAASYLWSTGATSQSINVTTAGNYSVTVTSAAGCSNTSTAVSVTVNPLPNASITPNGPTIFCQSDSVMLTSSVANSYLWSDNSTSQSINVTSSGNYMVTVTDANNCSSASPATAVTVNPNPPVPTVTQAGDSLISTASIAYQWYYNSALIPGAASQSYHPTQNGNYSVVITDANNCTASSTDYIFILTEIETLPGSGEILIYPNPAQDELIVWCSGFGDKSELMIYSSLGKIISKSVINNQKSEINISDLNSGLYFVEVKTVNKILREKFVKQ